MIKDIQKELNITVDGIAGSQTWAAIQRRILGRVVHSSIIPAIREVQKSIGTSIDGIAGPKTWRKLHDIIVPQSTPILNQDKVDERSERNIATLLPEVRDYARALIHKAQSIGIDAKIISGTRTYAEQNALYEQGRTKPGNRVTNAKGGYSNHNFGIAFDVGIFKGTEYLTSGKEYDTVGAIGKSLGLDWGGDWKTFKDKPHFQYKPKWAKNMSESAMLTEMRKRIANKQNII